MSGGPCGTGSGGLLDVRILLEGFDPGIQLVHKLFPILLLLRDLLTGLHPLNFEAEQGGEQIVPGWCRGRGFLLCLGADCAQLFLKREAGGRFRDRAASKGEGAACYR